MMKDVKKLSRIVMFAALLPLLSMGIVACEPENGTDDTNSTYEAVDLGLSVRWATHNVGAKSPEEYGGYYSWGETEEKSNYEWSTYKWGKDEQSRIVIKYCTNSEYGEVDGRAILEPEDDVAHVKWGDSWRMPTFAEFQELQDKCTWEWVTINGVNGYKVSGNGNSIFLPAAGCRYYDEEEVRYLDEGGAYWSSTLNEEDSDCANCFSFFPEDDYLGYDCVSRYPGVSIRPVTK